MPQSPDILEFTCNICEAKNQAATRDLMREAPTCTSCGSTVRWRSVIHALSLGLFGYSLGIWDFPNRQDLVGIGLSDWLGYAKRLPLRLAYRNTFYDEDPRLDITDPPDELEGKLDFLIASDVFEHVEPPVERAFVGSLRILKPGGLLVLTVPYSREGNTEEHFVNLHEYEIFDFKGRQILVNRTADKQWEVFEEPIFHGGPGATLEMRQFSGDAVLEQLRAAGFVDVVLCEEAVPEFGIIWPLRHGLPMLASRPRN